MFAELLLVAALGLVRGDDYARQQPRPEPPKPLVFRIWRASVRVPEWWSDRRGKACSGLFCEIVPEGRVSERPSIEVIDPWGQPETIYADWQLARETPLKVILDDERQRATDWTVPLCFPGEPGQ